MKGNNAVVVVPYRYSSVYAAHFTSDIGAAFKRSDSVFDGLNDVGTTGGRLSRRNSITDSLYSVGTRRSGSSAASVATNSANNSGDYPHVPAMLASYQANRLVAASSQTPSPATQHKEATRKNVKKDVSRQNSSEEAAAKSSGALSVSGSEGRVSDKERSSPTAPAHKVVKIKLRRKVSFTEREPVIINDNIEVRQQQQQKEDDEEPRSEASVSATEDPRMRRKRDKDRVKRRSSRRDRSQDAIKEERRKSQPLGEELFEQLNSKLKVIEKEQKKKSDEDKAKKEAAKALEDEKRTEEQVGIRHNVADSGYQSRQQHRPDSGGAFGESSCSSKAITSSECSPLQKPKNSNHHHSNRSSGGIFTAASIFGTTPSSSDAPSQSCQQQTSLPSSAEMVRLREKTASGSRNDSKSSSKRSSLDGKTVAGLAQDLAAECARAFALMESSLSKLSMDFSGKSQAGGSGGGEGGSGPFGLGARTKVKGKKRHMIDPVSTNRHTNRYTVRYILTSFKIYETFTAPFSHGNNREGAIALRWQGLR